MTNVDGDHDGALATIWSWLQEHSPAARDTDFDLDMDLIDTRLLTSLDVINFISFLEELSGTEIEITETTIGTLRTPRTIRDNYFREQPTALEETDSPITEDVRVANGLATLGPRMLEMRELLESRFVEWAADCGAIPMAFPPVIGVKDLSAFDYFRNFPHLAVTATPLEPDMLKDAYADAPSVETIPNTHLCQCQYVLPSAACYNVYLHLRGKTLDRVLYVTTVATCFRNETEFKGLERLWGFTMREIVCIGPLDATRAHLLSFKQRISEFAAQLDLSLKTQVATDPFYQPQDARSIMQQLAPVKEEFVYGETLAIASLNSHRNFFGERCSIRMSDQSLAFTSCVAFGLERWLHALLARFGNPGAAIEALSRLD